MQAEAWIDNGFIYLRGGDPRGADPFHRMVSGWPGWARMSYRKGSAASIFRAPLLASTADFLARSRVQRKWREKKHEHIFCELLGIPLLVEGCLNPHPSEQLKLKPLTLRSPRPHQAQAVWAIRHLKHRVLLGDDMGLGKTATALWSVYESGATRCVIVCPKSVVYNWPKEIGKTLGETAEAIVIDGPPAKRTQRVDYVQSTPAPGGKTRFVVVTWGMLPHLSEAHEEFFRKFADGEACILDESQNMKGEPFKPHRIKAGQGSGSKRTAFVLENLCTKHDGARVRILLSGTPVMNQVDDLHSQVTAIHPGTWTSRSDFVNRYLRHAVLNLPARKNKPARKFRKLTGSKNIDELNRVMQHVMIRRLKDEVGDLPPKIHTVPELELEGVELAIYQTMRDEAQLRLAELDEEMNIFHPEAKSAMEAFLRCEQIAQGFVGGLPEHLIEGMGSHLRQSRATKIQGRPGELMFPKSPKVKWLTETVEDLQKPVLVLSRFNAPLYWFSEHLDDARMMHGKTSAEQRSELEEDFQAGKFQVLLCQIRVAIGFTLTRAQDVLFYGRDWSPGWNSQAEDRTHRIGQTGTVNIQVPVVRNTVERKVHQRLVAKEADADQALKTMTIKELMGAL